MTTFIFIVFAFFGIFLYPIFLLGTVLIHFGHPVLGLIAIIYSIFKNDINGK